ncbi:hypothetical protein PoB_002676100 [Plakobranchus ocellatus]|uniref:Uncharacterized protein n=1 Tax=Plakobranchus ocellatus TaxID=259542 RepID=A0AAV4A0I2_9GAST|nr:hypothetical protein PoB_002676100 [Plakobranchus ocellatus]
MRGLLHKLQTTASRTWMSLPASGTSRMMTHMKQQPRHHRTSFWMRALPTRYLSPAGQPGCRIRHLLPPKRTHQSPEISRKETPLGT